MFLFTLFALLTAHSINGTISYDECLDMEFEPVACYQAKSMHDAGEKLCDIQGKHFDGKHCK